MNFREFSDSILNNNLPGELSQPLFALWHAKKGNWDTAHEAAQNISNNTGSWIHAVLHRQKGDLSNAKYWYRKLNKTVPENSFNDEFDEIIHILLSK